MRLQVSEYAADQLEKIWDHRSRGANEQVADRVTTKIIDDILWLLEYPHGGQFEPLLDHLGLDHRRLVSGKYKIIYRIIEDLIFVTDIFDTRQDPEKMAW